MTGVSSDWPVPVLGNSSPQCFCCLLTRDKLEGMEKNLLVLVEPGLTGDGAVRNLH